MTAATKAQTKTTKTVACPRCDGTGYIKGYSHVKDGICFKCDGTGKAAATAANVAAHKAAQAEKNRRPDMSKRIATELHIRAGYGGYIGYPEEDVLKKIDEQNKEAFKVDFCHYLAEHIQEWIALTA